MPFKIQGKVDGLQQLFASLASLENKIKRKILRKAATAAGGIILKRARQLVIKDTGLLKKSLGKKIKAYPSGVVVAVVGPRKGFRQPVTRIKGRKTPKTEIANPTKYAHLVELGTVKAPARPFLKPAIDGQQSAIRDAVANAIRQELAKG